MRPIYKIVKRDAWEAAEAMGQFLGSPVDLADGYIHFSEGDQLRETARKHYAGQDDLLLVTVDADRLDPPPVWEPSRGGALFPHLYEALDPKRALWVKPLPLGADGAHVFPPLEGE